MGIDDYQLDQDGGIFGFGPRRVNPINSLGPGKEYSVKKQIIYPDFSINNAINEINDVSNTDDLLDNTTENNIVKIAVEIYEKVYKIMFIQNEIASDKTSEYVNNSMSLLDPEAPPVIEDTVTENIKDKSRNQTLSQSKPGFVKKYSPFLRITKYMFYIAAIATTKIIQYISNKDESLKNSPQLKELFADLIYKNIEIIFNTSSPMGILAIFFPFTGQLKNIISDIFKYYIKYILLTQKYFELELIKKNDINFQLHENKSSIINVLDKLTKINPFDSSMLPTGGGKKQNKKAKQKSKTKKQNKKAKQKGKTKKQNKKAKQKGKTKRQNKKAKQKGKTKYDKLLI